MSLIVARKNFQEINIVSDTKLTYYHEAKGLKDQPQDGTIKVIVVSDSICVAFAGDVFFAKNALSEIDRNSEVDKIKNVLLKANISSSMQTDFIVALTKPTLSLCKIQNGLISDQENVWIGDYSAFEYFQQAFHGAVKSKSDVEPSWSDQAAIFVDTFQVTMSFDSHSDLGTKMADAMDKVIENTNIESVGGFRVQVACRERFTYSSYLNLYNGNLKFPLFGEHILSHGNAGNGGYTVNFIGSSSDNLNIAVHISQANLGIIYGISDSIFEPKTYKMDEVDFYDLLERNYKISALIATQDAFSKFWNEADIAFWQNDFIKAEKLLEKTLNSDGINQQSKDVIAECYCRRGFCHIRLNNPKLSMEMFQNAIRLDPQIQKKIMQFFKFR